MKRKNAVLGFVVLSICGVVGCGPREIELTAEQITVELGSELDVTASNYVVDEKLAEQAIVDFSAVDVMSVGTYQANVSYKELTKTFGVSVVDTVAPEVEVLGQTVIEIGETLYAKDIITGIAELSGAVEIEFVLEEGDVQDTSPAFELENVLLNNPSVVCKEVGTYDMNLKITDTSGNLAEKKLAIVVGTSPQFAGVENITVTVGKSEVDYLEDISASDCNGNDITDKIVCDSSAVELDSVGEYEVTYTVADENGFEAIETATVTVKKKKVSSSNTASATTGTNATANANEVVANGNVAGGATDATVSNNSSGEAANTYVPNTVVGTADNTSVPSTNVGSPAPSVDTNVVDENQLMLEQTLSSGIVFDPATNPPLDDSIQWVEWTY